MEKVQFENDKELRLAIKIAKNLGIPEKDIIEEGGFFSKPHILIDEKHRVAINQARDKARKLLNQQEDVDKKVEEGYVEPDQESV